MEPRRLWAPAHEMKREKKQEAGAPGWMLTMGDMNTLLLTFFVCLVSMLSWDERRVKGLEEFFDKLVMPDPLHKEGPSPIEGGERLRMMDEAADAAKARLEEVNIPGMRMRVRAEQEQTIVVLGDEEDTFAEGSAALPPALRDALTVLKAWRAGQSVLVEVRGYTAGNPEDSEVWLLLDQRWAPYREVLDLGLPPDEWEGPDHLRLGYRRAKVVAEFLAERRRVRDPAIRAGDIRVSTDGANQPLAGDDLPEGRARNRRVEIIITDTRRRG